MFVLCMHDRSLCKVWIRTVYALHRRCLCLVMKNETQGGITAGTR